MLVQIYSNTKDLYKKIVKQETHIIQFFKKIENEKGQIFLGY